MKWLFILLFPALVACDNGKRISRADSNKVFNDSSARVYSLDERSDREWVYYVNPSGTKVLLKKDLSGFTQRIAGDSLAKKVHPDDPFEGSIRLSPKTTYSTKTYKKYRTIPALYRKLESNQFMKDLSIGNSNERVEQEDKNINIQKAYLYTITLEADNDLHLLIGNTPVYKEGTTRVFNAEISGIPPDGTTAVKNHMMELREKAIAAMNDVPLCGRSGFLQANRRITIRGSLFFDSHHASKPAKCREVEGESAWEIHPVYDITFED
ncbi:MAG: hypothetical protein ABIR30_14270 [Chitinophagaceae bacterium]